MRPPDRFYYNIGEFFADMEQDQPLDNDFFHDMGRMVGEFFNGCLEATKDPSVSLMLTEKYMELQGIEIEFTEGDDEEDGNTHG